MRNATKSPKIPYFRNGEEMESDLESIWTIAPSKVNKLFRLVGPIITPSFNEIGSLLSNPAHRITHRQTDRKNDHITSLLAEVITTKITRHLAKFNHIQSSIFHIGVMLAYQLTDFMPWKLDVNSLQCFLQLHNRYEAISISIDLTQTQAFQHYITTSHFISSYPPITRAQLLPRMADRTRAVKTLSIFPSHKTTLFTSALRRIFSNR